MATRRTIGKLVAERDAKEQERADLESRGVRIGSSQIQAIDARLRELNDEIVAYGRTIPVKPGAQAMPGLDEVDSRRREESPK